MSSEMVIMDSRSLTVEFGLNLLIGHVVVTTQGGTAGLAALEGDIRTARAEQRAGARQRR